VVKGFAQSGEFIAQTDPQLNTWMRTVIGTDDVIVGGAGDNILAGGMMSDVFVFEAPSLVGDNNHIVLDLEAWDTVQLSGFGYISGSEALADMAQVGADVVFTKNGTEITFENTALGLFDSVDILV
jgi:Ca2+-binding RTX toxin-like protein